MPQLGTDYLAVCPAGSATEVLYVVFCHVAQSNQSMDAAQTNAISGRIRSGSKFPP
jgi:hypothetical protein